MWESTYLVDFQGLWEGWDSFIVPPFPSGRHFHRGHGCVFRFLVGSVQLTRVLLVSALCAVVPHLRFMLDVLLRFHFGEGMAQAFVLDSSAPSSICRLPTLNSGWGSDTLALQSYDILALHLQVHYT